MLQSATKDLDNITDILEVIEQERQDYTVEEVGILRKEQPGTFVDGQMTLFVRSRKFKKFRLQSYYLTEGAYTPTVISDPGADTIVEAAKYAYLLAKREALKHRQTGQHAKSITIYARSVGGIDKRVPFASLKPDRMPDRPVISIITSGIPYGRPLERLIRGGQAQGFLYYAAKQTRRRYRRAVSVRFDFLAGERAQTVAKGVPRIQIAAPGDLSARLVKPKPFEYKTRKRR